MAMSWLAMPSRVKGADLMPHELGLVICRGWWTQSSNNIKVETSMNIDQQGFFHKWNEMVYVCLS